jgi:microcystin-dependent protein
MSQPFIGQIMAVAFNFAPEGWAFCDGSLMSIAQNPALFDLIGTTYGGDGIATFALPDLRGRAVVLQGQAPGLSNYVIGEVVGEETHALTVSGMPSHTHALGAAATGTAANPGTNEVIGTPPGTDGTYAGASNPLVALASNSVGAAGAGVPHENRQPFLSLNYIIALFGIFPSQN